MECRTDTREQFPLMALSMFDIWTYGLCPTAKAKCITLRTWLVL